MRVSSSTTKVPALVSVQGVELILRESLRCELSTLSTEFSTSVLKTTGTTVERKDKTKRRYCGGAENLFASVPGNLPSNFLEEFLIDVEVGVHILHVILFFQGFEKSNNLGGGLALQLDVILRNHRDTGGTGRDACLLDRFEHGLVGGGFGEDFPVVAIVAEVFAAGLKHDGHEVIFLGSGFRDYDVTFFVEHPGDGAGLRHIAIVLAEHVTDFTDGAVAIVGIDLGKDGDSARAVALEREFLVGRAGQLAGAALDGALDVVGGHVLALGGEDGGAQTRIAVGIAATVFGGNADFLDQASKNLAALGIERALLVLDCGPF